jgi:hypothetical protein
VEIEFSEHAKKQLKRRNILRDLVTDSIKSPNEILPSFRERKLFRAQIGDKILEVVTKKEGLKTIVITAYYLEK